MTKLFTNIEKAIDIFAQGKFLIVVDDANRENEGDLIIAGAKISDGDMAFLIRHTSGIICSAISSSRAQVLNLPVMVSENEDVRRTTFTVSVDAKAGLNTGISSIERANTVRALASSDAKAGNFVRPGHIFPLIAHPDGLAGRRGHTEAAFALCQVTNQGESGVLSELVNDDGTVKKGHEIFDFGQKFSIPVISIQDLADFILSSMPFKSTSEPEMQWARLPHETGSWEIASFKALSGFDHVILRFGSADLYANDAPESLIRVHSECLTGEAFGSLRCDCGEQLATSFELIATRGAGFIIYLRGQEGRGIGLSEKIKAYVLQDQGLDTIEANLELGHSSDVREWRDLVQILDHLKIRDVDLITNNQKKADAIAETGRAVKIISITPTINEFNQSYLQTKRDKMQHMLGKIK